MPRGVHPLWRSRRGIGGSIGCGTLVRVLLVIGASRLHWSTMVATNRIGLYTLARGIQPDSARFGPIWTSRLPRCTVDLQKNS
jgi:hypothetical protein